MQTFDTMDVLRLEIEEPTPAPKFNLMRNPLPASIDYWTAAGGTKSFVSSGSWARVTFSAAGGPNNYGINWQDSSGIVVEAGKVYSAAATVRTSKAQRVALYLQFLNAGGANIGNNLESVAVAANTPTRIEVWNREAPAGAVTARLLTYSVSGDGSATWAVGDTLDAQRVILTEGDLPAYFDGATSSSTELKYGWTGTANASASVRESLDSVRNLVKNPSGELGAWGWVTPVSGALLAVGEGPTLEYTTPGGTSYFYTENMLMQPGQYVSASWTSSGGRARFEWLDTSGAVLSQSSQASLASGDQAWGPFQAPANTAYVRLRFDHVNGSGVYLSAGSVLFLRNVTVATAWSSATLGTLRVNMLPNPSVETNTTGWGSSDALARVSSPTPAYGSWCLRSTAGGGGTGRVFVSLPQVTQVMGGATYTLSSYMRAATVARAWNVRFTWLNASADVISTTAYTSLGSNATGSWTRLAKTVTAPPSAAYVDVRIESAESLPANEQHYFDAGMFERGSSATTFITGAVTTSNLSYIEPTKWLDILAPTHSITITREELNVGLLTATILDADLDPSKSDLIRPGRSVRARTQIYSSGPAFVATNEWVTQFTGKVTNAKVTYQLKGQTKRARIELTAVDNVATLAQQKRSEGVATLAELPYVLEGCGVPWNIDGSGNQVPTATVVARNDNASAVDQIAITRDSVNGYAFVDREGVLRAQSTALAGHHWLLGPNSYSDLDVDYDTERCINEVTLKFLRLNPGTGETEEIPYGPYRSESSIREWGVRSAEFTVQGIAEETTALADYAGRILAANGTPQVRVNSVTVPLKSLDDFERFNLNVLHEAMDLYSPLLVQTEESEYQQTIVGIRHSITPNKWLVTFDLASETSVAPPQLTPSPPLGSDGKTIGQLLRPVGEVTMWHGAKVDCPVGWLVLDGSTYSSATYPALFALLGSTTLPNYTDRSPIGAGTKALNSIGGTPTTTITTANLPPHTHTAMTVAGTAIRWVASQFGSGTARSGFQPGTGTDAITGNGGFANTPLDTITPWRATWFIIRAV